MLAPTSLFRDSSISPALLQTPAQARMDLKAAGAPADLEGEFYSWAAFGRPLEASLRGGGPPSIGGLKATLSPAIQVLLRYPDRLRRP